MGQLDRLVHCSSIFLGHLGSKYQYQRDCLVVPQISQNIQKMQQLASFVRLKNKDIFFTNYQKSSRWWKSFESRGRLVDCRLQRLNCGWKVEDGGWRMRILVEDGGWTNIWILVT